MSTCTAMWPGGHCDREAMSKNLCAGHYQQERRGRPFSELRGAHGKSTEELTYMGVLVPNSDAETMSAEAEARNVERSVIYREAVSAWAARLRKKAGK